MSEKIAPQFTCDTFGTLAPSMSRFFVSTHCTMGLNHFEGAIMSTIESLTETYLLFRKTNFPSILFNWQARQASSNASLSA